MKLSAKTRVSTTKGVVKQSRREKNIPAVIYSPGSPAQSIEVNGVEFDAVMRNMKQGRLATTIFTLDLDGKPVKAIVKDIQYNLTNYQVIHLDFEELKDDTPVKVKVPVECVGEAECVGIKLGGVMRQVIRQVKVKCLPKDIPAEFELDIQELKMKQVKRLSDIVMPKGVKPIAATDEVVVVIAKR
ncbi:MAG: 50S ribosomal protein L25 [Chlamydiae bacterium]|nr:50S ribosomal protein L25 [Chlamydiota bacterium]